MNPFEAPKIITGEKSVADERLGSIELTTKHESPSATITSFEDTIEHKRDSEAFEYQSGQISLAELIEQTIPDAEEKEQTLRTLYELGLEDITAEVFMRTSDDDTVGSIKDKEIYEMWNGWTGTGEIYSNVRGENGLTSVEETLARNPNAIVIAGDGNGFGGTTFRKELKGRKLRPYCTAEQYAKQVDFFTETLGLTPEDVRVLGHSMGGAMATVLAGKHGYTCVAAAPAAYPTAENIQTMKEEMEGFEIDMDLRKTHPLATAKNKILSEQIYNILGESVKASRILGKLSAPVVGGIFTEIAPFLMGKMSDDPSIQKDMEDSLFPIHQGELSADKLPVVSESILNLARGIDLSEWSMEDFSRLENLQVVGAGHDTLVTPPELNSFWAVATAMCIQKEQEIQLACNQAEAQGEIPEKLSIDLETAKKALLVTSSHFTYNSMRKNQVEGGHYAALYHPRIQQYLVESDGKAQITGY